MQNEVVGQNRIINHLNLLIMKVFCKSYEVAFAVVVGAVLCLLGACSRDMLSDDRAEPSPEVRSVSSQKALASLQRFLEETGSDLIGCGIETVEPLTYGRLGSEACSEGYDPERPVAYVVNFAGGGFALLDARGYGVAAVVEKGRMDLEDLFEVLRRIRNGGTADGATYVLAETLDGLVREASGADIHSADASVADTRAETVWGPYMVTTWNQDAPFNMYCPMIGGKKAKVGAVALALGQVLAYNSSAHHVSPQLIHKPGLIPPPYAYRPDWTSIAQGISTATPSSSSISEITRFLYEVGDAIGTKYGTSQSTATLANAAYFLSDVAGYKNVQVREPKLSDLQNMLMKSLPLVAYKSDNAWMIDGYKKFEDVRILIDIITGETYEEPYVDHYLYQHFGKGGEGDGWYKINFGKLSGAFPMAQYIYYTL